MLVVAVSRFPLAAKHSTSIPASIRFVRKDGVRGVVANSHTSGPRRRAAVSEPPCGPPWLGVRVKIKVAAFVKARMRAGLNWAGKCWRFCVRGSVLSAFVSHDCGSERILCSAGRSPTLSANQAPGRRCAGLSALSRSISGAGGRSLGPRKETRAAPGPGVFQAPRTRIGVNMGPH